MKRGYRSRDAMFKDLTVSEYEEAKLFYYLSGDMPDGVQRVLAKGFAFLPMLVNEKNKGVPPEAFHPQMAGGKKSGLKAEKDLTSEDHDALAEDLAKTMGSLHRATSR